MNAAYDRAGRRQILYMVLVTAVLLTLPCYCTAALLLMLAPETVQPVVVPTWTRLLVPDPEETGMPLFPPRTAPAPGAGFTVQPSWTAPVTIASSPATMLTATPTSRHRATATDRATRTRKPTRTRAPTATGTHRPTTTETPSPSITPSHTLTCTATLAPTATYTATLTSTATPHPTGTGTPTSSPAPTATLTQTLTPTMTLAPTSTVP